MSVWSKRLGTLGRHKHLAADIINEETREPEDLASGGTGVLVDNQSDPPAPVTTIVAPGAVIAGDTATLEVSQTVLSSTVSMTHAEFLAFVNVDGPKTLVATPGPGKALVYLNGFFIADTSGGYYGYDQTKTPSAMFWVDIGGNHVSADLNDYTNDLITFLQGEDISAVLLPPGARPRTTGDSSPQLMPPWQPQPLADFEDSPMTLKWQNGSGDPTGVVTDGDAANSFRITVPYTVVDL